MKNITAVIVGLYSSENIFPQDRRYTGTIGSTRLFVPQPSLSQPKPLMVYCDQTISSGGWLVFLRRVDHTKDFPNPAWQNYKQYFGDLTGGDKKQGH